ncbi:MAG: CYCXC family (seleno)protein [Candidatus Desulfatibia sp.]|uniref:CYCXC family (seleno)protein n=1 Tax=Candidatus Desulfatibia sp. TaxID=3101189 RepID=UPI002F2DAC0A
MSKKPKKTSPKKRISTKSRSKKASGKKHTKSPSSTKSLPIIIAVVIVIFIGGYFYDKYSRDYPIAIKDVSAANIDALRGGETRPALSPALFIGKTARAYKTARKNPELLDSIYCYCNCKQSLGHKSLLTCFVGKHAANCDICQDQALYAYSLYQKDNDIAKMRVAVDKRFWRPLR